MAEILANHFEAHQGSSMPSGNHVGIVGNPAPRARPSAMRAVPLTTYNMVLLRKTNQPDPDVWR